MILRFLFLTVFLAGCIAATDNGSFENKHLAALSNCVDRLRYHSSYLIDKKNDSLIEGYEKVRVVELEGQRINHIQFGVGNSIPKYTISDKPSGVCWFDSSYKVIALEAPESEETIGRTKYDVIPANLVEILLLDVKKIIDKQDTRKVIETIYVYDAGKWVLEGREERVEKINGSFGAE